MSKLYDTCKRCKHRETKHSIFNKDIYYCSHHERFTNGTFPKNYQLTKLCFEEEE